MSMVYLKHHNENIYNIENEGKGKAAQRRKNVQTNEQKVNFQPAEKYVSKFKEKVKEDIRKSGATHATMGYAQTPLSPPNNFLKRNGGIRLRKTTDHKCFKKEIAGVPRRNEAPKSPAPASPKNLRIENIKKVLSSAPKRPRPRFVDSRYGTVHDLYSSGLMPQYIFRPTYGKLPDYLSYLMENAESRAANGKYRSKQGQGNRSKSEEADIKYISQEERLNLLSGLKANWDKLQKRYQGLPVLTDTEPKRIAKANLEKGLKQLEQDIMLIENNPHIYVCERAN